MSCRKCWAPDAKPFDVVLGDKTAGTGELCSRCFDAALDRLEVLRAEFDQLIAAGVSREAANAHMIRKLDSGGAS